MKFIFNVLSGRFEIVPISIDSTGLLNGDIDFGTRESSDLFIEMGSREEDQSTVDQGLRV